MTREEVSAQGLSTALHVVRPWWYLLLLLVSITAANGAFVLDYTVTTATINSTSWGMYETNVCAKGGVLPVASAADDGQFFDPVGMSSPFFDDNSTPWYASPNGFLSATLFPMCSSFCTDVSINTLYGTYTMSATRGSDWPILGLFPADLNPGDTRSSARVCALTDSTGSYTIVDYSAVPMFGTSNYVDDVLTAQVVVYKNGTFVFRYDHIPASLKNSGNLPVVGISATASRFVTSPVTVYAGLALRFEPIFDTCTESPSADSESACRATGDCVWCAATDACMHTTVAPLRCPSGTFTAGPSIAATRYSVKVDYDGALTAQQAVPMLVSPGAVVGTLLTDFSFPFFTTSGQRVREIALTAPSVFTFGGERPLCNPLWNTCVNANYTNAILPYQSAAFRPIDFSSTALPARPPGGLLCPSSASTSCPPGTLFRISTIMMAAPSLTINAISTQMVDAQLFIDGDGTIDIVVRATDADVGDRLYTYPPALIGVVRNGLSDPESLVIPSALIRNGLHVRYTLVQGACPDCGLHGRCDGAAAVCVCDAGFTGTLCDACQDATRYGADCAAQCPNCLYGTCDGGPHGTGLCRCPEGRTGPQCEKTCAVSSNAAATPPCATAGGYVECGVCRCYEGWHGTACDSRLPDPCQAHSLDGCQQCAAQQGCSFCYDNTCFSPSLSGSQEGYACSYASPFPQSDICKAPPMVAHTTRAYDLTLGFLLGVVLLLIIVLAIVVVCLTCSRRNVYDIHVANASGGAPDLAQPRREREVRQVAVVAPTKLVQSRHVLAVPLKQISLKKLYEKQHGIATDKKNS